ncbi:MAG: flagellar basal body P-ring formation protein FlgA [Geobacteraceae bacterium]|nr:flagellar basal body P-ring formation protein FlgA [Geobacteraceae bacterium]
MLCLVAPCGAAQGRSTGTVLKEKAIRDAVSSFLLDRTKDAGMEIRIKKIGATGDMTVPSGNVTYEFIVSRQWEGWGKSLLGLVVRVDGQIVKNLSIPVEVEALAGMVVSLRPLERGEVIGEGDVALQKRDIASAPGKVCRELDQVIGKKVRVAVRGNMPIRGDFLEKVPLVKYGQLVTIIAENGSLRVTAAGKAKGAGAEGDTVLVENLSSRKDIHARVVDSGTVAVDF